MKSTFKKIARLTVMSLFVLLVFISCNDSAAIIIVQTPTITERGQYNDDRNYRMIEMSCLDNSVTIYYTTDGSTPTEKSSIYSPKMNNNVLGEKHNTILVRSGSIVKAIAYKNGTFSEYVILYVSGPTSTPTVTEKGVYNENLGYRLVQLNCNDLDAKVYYTTDGTTPTTSSSEYSPSSYINTKGYSYNSVLIPAGSTVYAVAYKNGIYSDVYSLTLSDIIPNPTVENKGQYNDNRSYWLIQLNCNDTSASIYYTLDGTTPTTSSTRYSANFYKNVSGNGYYSIMVPAESILKVVANYNDVYSDVITYEVPSAISSPTIINRGQYESDRSYSMFELSCSDTSATIYYTTDGSTPTTSSMQYSASSYTNVEGKNYDSILVYAGSTLKAMAYKEGIYSDIVTYTVPSGVTTPIITYRGQYSNDRSYRMIQLSCSTSSATIYYTIDGSTPTTSSTRYSASTYTNISGSSYSSILVPAGATLKAVTFKNNTYSDVASYSVPSIINTPTISDRGQYNGNRAYRLITLDCDDTSATIYYTINGTNPTTSSTSYSGKLYTDIYGNSYSSILVQAGTPLKVVAYSNNAYSEVVSYSVPATISTPTITDRGQYSDDITYRLIEIGCNDSSDTIYYTTDGSTPTKNSSCYSASSFTNVSGNNFDSILVPAGTSLKVVAYNKDTYSDVVSYSLPSTVNSPNVAYGGQYIFDWSKRLVQINCDVSAAIIYYTTDGSTPTINSNSYSASSYANIYGNTLSSITVPAGSTLKAVAYYNSTYSEVLTYSVPSAISMPVVTDRGQYGEDKTKWLVQLSCNDPSLTINYTTDGSTPKMESSKYNASSYTNVLGDSYESICVPTGSTLKVITFDHISKAYSDVLTYSVPSIIPTPSITDKGQYSSDRSYHLIQLKCADPSAIIYYTTDGSDPTTSSTLYDASSCTNILGETYSSVLVSAGSTLKVMAYKDDAYSLVDTFTLPSKVDAPTLTDCGQLDSDRSYRLIKLECKAYPPKIYYTIDGSDPTANSGSREYYSYNYTNVLGESKSSVRVPVGSTLKAVVYSEGDYSDVITYSIPDAVTAPTIKDEGQYENDRLYRLIQIECADPSATIYYTINGTNPTTSSTEYSPSINTNIFGASYSSILLSGDRKINVVAYKDNSYSDVVTYNLPGVLTTPHYADYGQYEDDRSYRLINLRSYDPLDTTIYYTIDGSMPTTDSLVYSASSYTDISGNSHNSVKIPAGVTLKFASYSNNIYSDVVTYSVPSAVSTPTITDRGQSYGNRSNRLITLSCDDSNATIYYTTYGNIPTTSSTKYSASSYMNIFGKKYSSISIPAGTTLKVVAYYNGSYSDVITYSIPSEVITPYIADRGQYIIDRSYRLFSFVCNTDSATIYYSLDGSEPTTSSNKYDADIYTNISGDSYSAVLIPAGSTLKVVAYYNDTYSNVLTYSVKAAITAPTITNRGMYYNDNAQNLIQLECSDSSSTIYYTIDGTTPTTSSTKYTASTYNNISGKSYNSILVPEGVTVQCVAYNNKVYSDVATYSVPMHISVNTNGQWESYDCGLDSSSYYSYYSTSNYNIGNSSATMYLTINGFETFTLYIRSSAEMGSDYTIAYEVDSETIPKEDTSTFQRKDGSYLYNYKQVVYSGLGGTTHTIRIDYKKDNLFDEEDDRGYLVIPKNQ